MSAQKDLIIIGAGPGGYVAAIRAAQLGLSTVLVEQDKRLGGTCLLRGCIPTKALLEVAYMLNKTKSFKEFGITASGIGVDWAAVQERKDKTVFRLAKGVEFLMKKNKIEVVYGRGRLTSPGAVEAAGDAGASTTFTARNILFATGSEPRLFPPFDLKHPGIITSNEALELKSIPASVAVIGAGAVGVEFACVFQAVGSQVTLIEILDQVLPFEDPDVATVMQTEIQKRGMKVHTSTKVEAIEPAGDGLKLRIAGPKGSSEIQVGTVLVAVGRRPVTEGLGLEAAGIAVEKGFIRVNEYCQTTLPGHFAIGDCIATPQLAHVASAEGKLAVERMAGSADARPINYDQIPFCTYGQPEVARVGLTEAEARKRGIDFKVGKYPFLAHGKAGIIGEREGFVKILAEKKFGEIVGASIVGPHATELIAEPSAFMAAEGTMSELVHMVHAHPTLYEAIVEAGEAWAGHPVHS